MGFLDLFNKWIVEHGSTVVQEKQIAFFRDQMAAADKKILVLETENTRLTSENSDLKATVNQLTKENEVLRQKIQEYENPHKTLLNGVKLEILKLLYSRPKLQKEQITQSLSIDLSVADLHLSDLKKLKMVKQEALPSRTIKTPFGWSLDKEGTRYLLENKQV